MSEKMNKVNSWLSAVFGDQPVPQFEVSTRTIHVLYQLAQSSEARCSDTAQLIEDLKQKTSEYQADVLKAAQNIVQRVLEQMRIQSAAHLQEVLLQGVGLSSTSLSKLAADCVSALVDNAMVLGVRDTSLGSFLPAVNHLTSERLEAEKLNRQLARELSGLRKQLGATLVLRGTIQEDIEKITESQVAERAKAEERMLNIDFVTTKARELSNSRERSEAQLLARKMDKSITHQAVVQLSQEVDALKNELIPLKKKLEPYMDLSPSPSLAQVKIEEAKRELAALESKLEKNVDFK